MVKKFVCLLTLLTIFLSSFVTAYAEDSDAVIGRAYVYKPKVNVELYNVREDVNDCKVSLGNRELNVENYQKYDKNKHKSVVYIVIDKSISNNSFNNIKTFMIHYVNNLSEKDQVVYITFGNKVSKPIKYSSCNSKTKKSINKAINSIKCNENKSSFYDAVAEAYNMSVTENESYDRRYAIIATSGLDDKSQTYTKSQVKSLYETHMLPVFSLCSSTVENSDTLNDLSTISGGKIFRYNSKDINNTFNLLENYVNENVLLVNANSDTNGVDSVKRTLSVELNGKTARSLAVPINSLRDDVVPTAKIKFDPNNYYEFNVTFSENVRFAGDYSKYKIKHNEKICEVSKIKKISDTQYKIIMSKPISSGDYYFSFDGIVDTSMQRNNVEATTLKNVTSNKYIIHNVIVFASIGLAFAIIIALVIIIKLKRKKEKQKVDFNSEEIRQQEVHFGKATSDVQHRLEFENLSGVNITLTVSKQGTVPQIINSTVCGSIMVGRGEICDVCIEDKLMSRQHFALEESNNSIIITDLETLNGTYVNSFRLSKPQKLNDGDEIIAGSCKIKFHYRNGE